jgi:tetratricopeptide (TPR) repeat protein
MINAADRLRGMARRDRNSKPGGGLASGSEPLGRAAALSREHEGHQCAERADDLCEAAEHYALLGEYRVADELFREALTVEEAEPGKPQAAYAAFLLDQGSQEDAFKLIAEARRLRPHNPEVFLTIGLTLARYDHHEHALRWFTAGLVEQLGALTDVSIDDLREHYDLWLLAVGRHRSRRALELAPDHIDDLTQELRAG